MTNSQTQGVDPKVELELAKRVLARRSLIQFTKRFYPQYNPGWVHHDIARRLEQFMRDVEEKKSPRLMLLVPPRHGKSELASIRFPAFVLGHHPEWEVINCGYNLDLPMKFSRKVREIVRDPGYNPLFVKTQMDPDSQSAEAWNTTMGGGFTAAGVGGGITGKGATVLIIDDPIKNQEEADSIVTRDSLWDWYWSTAYTRLAPGGGVLVIQCMTGDTPVLMGDGDERRLDSIKVGDVVATYDRGALSTSTVSAIKSNGCDSVLRITTKSGKVVRANGRHPFLADIGGDLKWIRAKSLTTAHRIVALKDNTASGAALRAQQMAATNQLFVEGSVNPITTNVNGPMDTELQVRWISEQNGALSLRIGTESPSTITSECSENRTEPVPFAEVAPQKTHIIGKSDLLSITATIQEKLEGSYVTTATPLSDILDLSPLHLPLLNTSDFILDPVVSVEFDGEEEVFDLQVERTENFIANGLVSHNTWWHDDDLAGRLQQKMRTDEESDQFVIIKYPAIAEAWEYRNHTTGLIERLPSPMDLDHVEKRNEQREQGVSIPIPYGEEYELLRMPGEALHPERYNEKMMTAMKANQPVRIWSALYQQNPVPDEGMYFRKEYFKFESVPPAAYQRNVFQAWDFAIGEKQMNDYTVGATIIQDENDFLHVVEIVRFRGDSFTIVEEILNAAERWGGEPTAPLTLGFEESQIWKAIKPLLEKRMAERGMYPPYETLKPLTDKMARARSLQGRMQQGRVYFPQNAPWVNTLMTEFLRFPAGAHDDIVDAMAWAVNLCVGRNPRKLLEVKAPKSWKDKLPQFVEGGSGSWMAA
jgi:predicted phage terminase large subunit-like protein